MKSTQGNWMGKCWGFIAVNLCCASGAWAGGFVAGWGNNIYGEAVPPPRLADARQISAGDHFSVALRANGTVAAWGANDYGQCNVPVGLNNVRSIAAGYSHTLAVRYDGTVVAWGMDQENKTKVPAGLASVTAVAAGSFHSMALRADGRVIGWGSDLNNQIGALASVNNAIAVAACSMNSVVLTADGRVTVFGDNTYGQTNVPSSLTNAISISAGAAHVVALKADGTVVSWGWNGAGQTNVPPGLSNVIAIAAGHRHTLALKADGTLVGWGESSNGLTANPTSLKGISAISAGSEHNLAIVSEKVTSPIGKIDILNPPQNQEARLGSNAVFTVTALSNEPLTYQWRFKGVPLANGEKISGATSAELKVKSIVATDAGYYTVVISNAFEVAERSAWLIVLSPPVIVSQEPERTIGAGMNVQLSATVAGKEPLYSTWSREGVVLSTQTYLNLANVQPSAEGLYVFTVTNMYGSAASNTYLHVTNTAPQFVKQPSITIRSQNNIWTWAGAVPIGYNLTIESEARGSGPITYQWKLNGNDISGATNAFIALSDVQMNQTGWYMVIAKNAFGQATSSKVFLNVVQVMAWGPPFANATNLPVGLSNVVAIAAGGSHVLALKSDGFVTSFVADRNFIFDSAAYLTNIPPSVNNIMAISAGRSHGMGLKSNGTVVAWGNNSFGQTNVPPGLSNVVAVSAGYNFCVALRSNGTVAMWGSAPKPASDPTNLVAVSAGAYHVLALKRDGTVMSWGNYESPTNVPAGLSNIVAVAAAPSHNLALRADGRVVAWSRLANTGTNVPPNLSNVVAIAAASSYSMALREDGRIVEWGLLGRKDPSPMSNAVNVTAIAAGGVQSSYGVALIGNGAPVFTIHPADQVVAPGSMVQLHGRVSGKQPMGYQWLLDSVKVPGATNSSLVIRAASGKDTGAYRLLAYNEMGSVLSRAATVSIPFNMTLPQALNATNMSWATNISKAHWMPQIKETHDGVGAAQSGPTEHGQTALVSTYVYGPGKLTFWWKTSSEQGYDFLEVYTNYTQIPYAKISGETEWTQVSIQIPQGKCYIQWAYRKDASVSSGRDAGWLDEVSFDGVPPIIVAGPESARIPAGTNLLLRTVVNCPNPVSYEWLKNGEKVVGQSGAFLRLSNVTRQNSGLYACRVWNDSGSAVSSNAEVVVLVPQRLGAFSLLPNGTVQLTATPADGMSLSSEDVKGLEAQASTDLVHWESLTNSWIIEDGGLRLVDTNASNCSARFYRILER